MAISGPVETEEYLNPINSERTICIVTLITNLSKRPSSEAAVVGAQMQAISHGPQSALWPFENEEEERAAYGWATLTLEIRTKPRQGEIRAIYANLFDEDQQFAVLRAVSWNWQVAREAMEQEGSNYKPVLPSRFVKIPVTQLKRWLSAFDNISCAINEEIGPDDDTPTRRLRIERDYAYSIFEMAWQLEDVSHQVLNDQWDQVWIDMSRKLADAPILDRIDEDFWHVTFEFDYDFEAYQPNNFSLT